MNRGMIVAIAALTFSGPVPAQTSPSHRLVEHSFNAGGDPMNGAFASSASFRIKLDALGDPLAARTSGSPSHHLDSGFVAAYPPPGEVRNGRFTSKTTLVWDADRAVGSYNVYRDTLSSLPGSFGACFQPGVSTEAAIVAASPALGTGWFYLVTAANLLGEEGTKGSRSNGTERPNAAPCP